MENNFIESKLFNYLDSENNNQFSAMSKSELDELIFQINNYYLERRQDLAISDYITFGLEIELEYTKENIIKEIIENLNISNEWIVKGDNSLAAGAEITSPILIDKVESWNELEKICASVDDYAKIGPNCGGHIHVGTQIINSNPEVLINFIKLWVTYENVIYRFLYGEYLTARPNIIKYAKPISRFVWDNCENIYQIPKSAFDILVKEIFYNRNEAINFNNFNLSSNHTKNTIEFRNPNGSLDPVIWQNNVNLLVKMFLYADSSLYDDDTISKRKQSNENEYSLDNYNEIYLEQSLELCDMIFENNLDKIYFLRQYLKSFEKSNDNFTKAKTFTR